MRRAFALCACGESLQGRHVRVSTSLAECLNSKKKDSDEN